MSISEIALRIRETVTAQRTPEQLAKTTTVWRETARVQKFLSVNPPNGRSFLTTSWAAGGLGDLDFSGALLSEPVKQNGGRVVFIGGSTQDPGLGALGRSTWAIIMGKVREDETQGGTA